MHSGMVQEPSDDMMWNIINPRRACAARVTVLGLSFRLSVTGGTTFSPATRRRPKSDTNGFSATLALFEKLRFW